MAGPLQAVPLVCWQKGAVEWASGRRGCRRHLEFRGCPSLRQWRNLPINDRSISFGLTNCECMCSCWGSRRLLTQLGPTADPNCCSRRLVAQSGPTADPNYCSRRLLTQLGPTAGLGCCSRRLMAQLGPTADPNYCPRRLMTQLGPTAVLG